MMTRKQGKLAEWWDGFNVGETGIRGMMRVDEPGGVIGRDVKEMVGKERVWEEVDMHVIIDEQ